MVEQKATLALPFASHTGAVGGGPPPFFGRKWQRLAIVPSIEFTPIFEQLKQIAEEKYYFESDWPIEVRPARLE